MRTIVRRLLGSCRYVAAVADTISRQRRHGLDAPGNVVVITVAIVGSL
jgi:hypothetical protein